MGIPDYFRGAAIFLGSGCRENLRDNVPFTAAEIGAMNTTYNFLDLTAKGRDEKPDATQDWVRYHDQYKGASKDCCA